MPVKKYILNGRSIQSMDDFYDQLAAKLPLPEHFGRNLDALWDVLSTDIEGPFEIVWKKAGSSGMAPGTDMDRIMTLLKKLENERDDFRFKVEK